MQLIQLMVICDLHFLCKAELDSESVETVALDTKAAYTAFKGKGVATSGVGKHHQRHH